LTERKLVIVRPLLSLKRRPHFKTRNTSGKNKHISRVPRRPETKYDCAGEGYQIFAGLNWKNHNLLREDVV
jgi:hypothetical protein